MSAYLEPILHLPPGLAYLVIGLLVFGEAAVFVGFVLPGETAVVLGGVLASQHVISIWALGVLVVLAAIVGDSVGYEVGRHYGDSVLDLGPLRRHRSRLDGAREFLRTRGGSAVFLGRWTAFLRAVMPGLAGLSRMPYGTFLAYNALGGVVWGVTFCLVGYLAGNSYHLVEKVIGRGAAVMTVLVLLVAAGLWHRHRRRSERGDSQTTPPPESGGHRAA
ncbi:MAG: DedA family protein [Kineosporiaceae bacterium]